ncbi:MAG: nitrilase-related carbon-nitrogen hydrolase [Clostridia bacterium]
MNIGNLFALNGKIETEALSVVGIQFAPIGAQTLEELNQNTDTVIDYLDLSVSAFPGVDLVVFPESCFQGFAPANFKDAIMMIDSTQIARVCKRCRDLSIWGVFDALLWADSHRCYENTAFIVNDHGEIVHTYVKMNPWIPFENSRPGTECTVCNGPKGSRLGVIICADGDYPEIWREAAYRGANVILRPTHYMDPWNTAWDLTNRASAYFNQVYVVGVNCSGLAKNESRSCFGRSMIVGPDGNIITEASNGCPGLIKADLYPGIIDRMREQSVHSSPMFSFRHRGASCPDFNGKGDSNMRYTAYADKEKK